MKNAAICISLRSAAYSLFDAGWTENEVTAWIKTIKQPSPGYIKAEDMPGNRQSVFFQCAGCGQSYEYECRECADESENYARDLIDRTIEHEGDYV